MEDTISQKREQPTGSFNLMPQFEKHEQQEVSASVRLQEVFHQDELFRSKLDKDKLNQAIADPEKKKQLLAEMRLSDRVNRMQVQKMLEAGELKTDDDFNIAAIIFQHGENTTDCKQAFELSLKAIKVGQPTEAALTPAAFDRYIMHVQLEQGIPLEQITQRFGTQTYPDANGVQFKPGLDDKATPQELRLFGKSVSEETNTIPESLDKDVILKSLEEKLNKYSL